MEAGIIGEYQSTQFSPKKLRSHRSEVIEMYYWEYDEEAHHWANN